jgi:hypothetical protein
VVALMGRVLFREFKFAVTNIAPLKHLEREKKKNLVTRNTNCTDCTFKKEKEKKNHFRVGALNFGNTALYSKYKRITKRDRITNDEW